MLCMGCSNGLSWGEAATEGCYTLGEWNVWHGHAYDDRSTKGMT